MIKTIIFFVVLVMIAATPIKQECSMVYDEQTKECRVECVEIKNS